MINQAQHSGGWRQTVLAELVPGVSDFYIVEDPDHLMMEPGIQKVLAECKFVFYAFDNSIALRYFYELKVRHSFKSSEYMVISIDTEKTDIRELPFDIINHAKIVSLSLAECFPDVHYGVLQYLQPEELDLLYSAVCEYTPGKMVDKASRDFVLRHIYHVAPELIQSPSDLLRTLLRLHYRDIELPELLKSRLFGLLIHRNKFSGWPLEDIISSKQAFFRFLQEQWPPYIETLQKSLKDGFKEPPAVYENAKIKDKSILLPFGHDDVRVYMDNLFLEGLLTPIEIEKPEKLTNHWSSAGIQIDTEKEKIKRIDGLIALCLDSLPDMESRHQTWIQFASRWAELCSVVHSQLLLVDTQKFIKLRNLVDSHFKNWMLANYQNLHNHPPIPPAMLHHIPRNMQRDINANENGKSALILIDGLALDQWVTLRNGLTINHITDESGVFAWVPTITSVSRQALFSGKVPYQFSKTIDTTSTEPKAWKNYWQDSGLQSTEIFYEKGLGTDDIAILVDKLSDHRLRAIGLVINTIDDTMHGMKLGAAGMHKQVELWSKSGYLSNLINALVSLGFTIHLTSDHGNVEAIGCGKISEGSIAKTRGERARVYKTETLRTKIYESYTASSEYAVEWPQIGLPSGYWPIVMSGRNAFVANNEVIVAHGGISIEEVIVPYIKIMRESNEC